MPEMANKLCFKYSEERYEMLSKDIIQTCANKQRLCYAHPKSFLKNIYLNEIEGLILNHPVLFKSFKLL